MQPGSLKKYIWQGEITASVHVVRFQKNNNAFLMHTNKYIFH